MMETEMMLRLIAIVVASGLLLSSFDYSLVTSYVKNLFKRTPRVAPATNKEVEFLDVVESWHTLKNQCKELGLEAALEKLDEVFPLLNMEE
jgi:hypothetical protein